MRPSICFVLPVAVLLAFCAGCRQPVSPTGGPGAKSDPPQVQPDSEKSPELIKSTLSCSGRGCHADMNRDEKMPRYPSSCAYSLWSDDDPHVKAYDVLSGPLGQHMGRMLGTPGKPHDVTKDKRCLACHVTPQSANETITLDGVTRDVGPVTKGERVFGVGCESCHGPAMKWLVPHRDTKWRAQSGEKKQEDGLINLTDLTTRARTCAGCHVGAPADPKNNLPLRDMNHDFIAAGHPRLMFEFGAFMANEPKHWKEKAPNTGANFDARAWAIGQVVAAEAAMKLLADRAKHGAKPNDERPWPEFSEYDCYACHHNIERDSWRVKRGYGKARPGRFRPSRWYTGLSDLFPPGESEADDENYRVLLRRNINELENKLRSRYPSPDVVAKKAEEISQFLATTLKKKKELERWAESHGGPRRELTSLVPHLVGRGQALESSEWDVTEQVALGLLALYRSEGNKPGEEKTREILKRLAFPRGSDSPNFSPFDEQVKKLFGELKPR